MEECYMCDAEGVTKEHVPPKCIFPEAKDVKDGRNFRRNLITVYSCDKHNQSKSQDDEYLLFCLAVNIRSNYIAHEQFNSKVIRAMQRRPHVYEQFSKNFLPVNFKNKNGKQENTRAVEINVDRFNSSIKHISYALYYYKFKKRFIGDIKIITDGMISLLSENSIQINRGNQRLANIIDEMLDDIEAQGDNEDIFTYKLLETGNTECQIIIQMNFYDGFKVTSLMTYS